MRTNSVLHHLFQFLKTCPNKCPTNFEKLHSFLCTLGLCVNVLRLECHVNALLALRAAGFVFPHSEKLSENYSMYSENVLRARGREDMLPISYHNVKVELLTLKWFTYARICFSQDSEVYICPFPFTEQPLQLLNLFLQCPVFLLQVSCSCVLFSPSYICNYIFIDNVDNIILSC